MEYRLIAATKAPIDGCLAPDTILGVWQLYGTSLWEAVKTMFIPPEAEYIIVQRIK